MLQFRTDFFNFFNQDEDSLPYFNSAVGSLPHGAAELVVVGYMHGQQSFFGGV